MEIDQAYLPPVEYLIMEVLGSRKRLGEDRWTFPSKLNSWLNSLAKKGLLNWKAGVYEQTSVAWLTEEGHQCCLSEEYLLTREYQDCTGQTSLPNVSQRLREQYGLAERECDAPDCGNRYLPSKSTKTYCSEKCRQRVSNMVQKTPFTEDMAAQLLEDALAGRIRAWQQ